MLDFGLVLIGAFSNMSSHVTLPQELCDDIIDHLHDDVETLKCCSLVCHDWLPSTSLHLFSRFKWPPCSKSGTMICPEDTLPGEIVSSLQATLEAHPRLSPSIQDFTIATHSTACKRTNGASLDERETTKLLHILHDFHRLRKLSVNRFPLRLVPLPPKFLGALTVDELLVHSDRWWRGPGSALTMTVEQLLALLSCFKGVRKLRLEGKFGDPVTDLSPKIVARPSLRAELLSISTAGHVLAALHGLLDFQAVQRLQFASLPEDPVPALASMTNLRSLEYDIGEYNPATVLAGGPAPLELTLHGTLTIFTHPKWAAGSYTFPWRELLRDLGALDTSALRTLVVRVRVYDGGFGEDNPALAAQTADVLRELRPFFVGFEEVVLARCAALQRVEMHLVEGRALDAWYVFRGFERVAREGFVSERMQGIFHVDAPQGYAPLERASHEREAVASEKSLDAGLRTQAVRG